MHFKIAGLCIGLFINITILIHACVLGLGMGMGDYFSYGVSGTPSTGLPSICMKKHSFFAGSGGGCGSWTSSPGFFIASMRFLREF